MDSLEKIDSIVPSAGVEKIENMESDVKISRLLNDDDMKSIEKSMLDKFTVFQWGERHAHEYARNVPNESRYFLEGTLNLIEKVVDATKSGEGYDTLIFLDKSARPGAYLYREMISMLKEKGIIEGELALPEVKFMDIGKREEGSKVKSDFTASVLREKIKPENLGKRVLVVDEFEDTGATLRNALTEITDVYSSETQDFEVEGTYQYNQKKIAPFFYQDSQRGASLVRDVESGFRIGELDDFITTGKLSEVVSIRDGVSEEGWSAFDDVMSYKSLAEKLPREVFVDVVESSDDGFSVSTMIEIIRKYRDDFDVESIVEDLNAVCRTSIKAMPQQIYDYFKYAGGRLAAPLKGDREFGLNLRKMLKHLVFLSGEAIDKSEQKS
jgi:hypoxanthine phosphoribosyltransferase